MHNQIMQNTEEWKEMRRTKIGASDAPVIMGVSPWRTPYQLWQEKLAMKSWKENSAMRRGHNLESKAIEKLEHLTGELFSPKVIFHRTYEWMMASLDGMNVEGNKIAEVKCAGKVDHEKAMNGEVPEKYIPQLQHQMEVAQVENAIYFSFDGDNGVIVNVYRDDKYIKKMLSKEKEFYECIQELIAPDLTEKDYEMKSSEIWNEVSEEWKRISSQIFHLQKLEKGLRELLVRQCQDKNSIGNGITVSKILRKGNIDYSKVPELKNVNLEQYRGENIEFWKICNSK